MSVFIVLGVVRDRADRGRPTATLADDRPARASPVPSLRPTAAGPAHRPHRRRRVPPRPPRPVHRRAGRRSAATGASAGSGCSPTTPRWRDALDRPGPPVHAHRARGRPATTARSSAASSTTASTAGRRRRRRRDPRRPAGRDRVADDHRGRLRRDRLATTPRSTCIAAALERRRDAGTPPLTILSCDNLPGNGDAARPATLAAARRRERRAGRLDRRARARSRTRWSTGSRRRPPTTTGRGSRDEHGIVDRWPVVAEPFRQWVVEDRFVAGRPRVGGRRRGVHRRRRRRGSCTSCACSTPATRHGLPVPRWPASRSSTRRWPRRRCAASSSDLLDDEAIPSLHRDPRPPAGGLRGDGAAPLRQHRRARPDRPAVHRRHGEVPDVPRARPSSTSSRTAGRSRCGALALAGWARYLGTVPTPSRRPTPPATSRRALRRRGARPSRPGSSSSTACSRPRCATSDRFRDAFVDALSTASPTTARSPRWRR